MVCIRIRHGVHDQRYIYKGGLKKLFVDDLSYDKFSESIHWIKDWDESSETDILIYG
jgi:hypothetical protein